MPKLLSTSLILMPDLSEIGILLDDIFMLLSACDYRTISFRPRDCNRVAHNLAHLAISSSCDFVLLEECPPCVVFSSG
ncbi:hypothetical protein Ddye_018332 [Dipteronia dyeriana]|uniref:RNase H type-1 domain-containing protein n=1 Tax=Dipteronia dyeriana TaxID=168575 RepID=A0AAD9UAZ5_9ROSI|nr:hypothetical protein Ddye_018332 [Dipteronia dyeriana]